MKTKKELLDILENTSYGRIIKRLTQQLSIEQTKRLLKVKNVVRGKAK